MFISIFLIAFISCVKQNLIFESKGFDLIERSQELVTKENEEEFQKRFLESLIEIYEDINLDDKSRIDILNQFVNQVVSDKIAKGDRTSEELETILCDSIFLGVDVFNIKKRQAIMEIVWSRILGHLITFNKNPLARLNGFSTGNEYFSEKASSQLKKWRVKKIEEYFNFKKAIRDLDLAVVLSLEFNPNIRDLKRLCSPLCTAILIDSEAMLKTNCFAKGITLEMATECVEMFLGNLEKDRDGTERNLESFIITFMISNSPYKIEILKYIAEKNVFSDLNLISGIEGNRLTFLAAYYYDADLWCYLVNDLKLDINLMRNFKSINQINQYSTALQNMILSSSAYKKEEQCVMFLKRYFDTMDPQYVVNIINRQGLLHYAALGHSLVLLKFLLDMGGDPNLLYKPYENIINFIENVDGQQRYYICGGILSKVLSALKVSFNPINYLLKRPSLELEGTVLNCFIDYHLILEGISGSCAPKNVLLDNVKLARDLISNMEQGLCDKLHIKSFIELLIEYGYGKTGINVDSKKFDTEYSIVHGSADFLNLFLQYFHPKLQNSEGSCLSNCLNAIIEIPDNNRGVGDARIVIDILSPYITSDVLRQDENLFPFIKKVFNINLDQLAFQDLLKILDPYPNVLELIIENIELFGYKNYNKKFYLNRMIQEGINQRYIDLAIENGFITKEMDKEYQGKLAERESCSEILISETVDLASYLPTLDSYQFMFVIKLMSQKEKERVNIEHLLIELPESSAIYLINNWKLEVNKLHLISAVLAGKQRLVIKILKLMNYHQITFDDKEIEYMNSVNINQEMKVILKNNGQHFNLIV